MMLQYGLSNFETTQEFLCILAKRTGQLRKGAVPDVLGAAKKILHEWNTYAFDSFFCYFNFVETSAYFNFFLPYNISSVCVFLRFIRELFKINKK